MEIVTGAWISEDIQKQLQQGMTGEVLLVNSSGVYLCFGERMLLLCDESWGLLPVGIAIENYRKAVKDICLAQGQRVRASDVCLDFPGGKLRLVPRKPQPEDDTPAVPEEKRILRAAEEIAALRKNRGISLLVLPLVLGRPMDADILQNPWCVRAYRHLGRLMKALRSGERTEICPCVERLLGLGPGLTPSADDVMLGMLYVFRKIPGKHPEAVEAFRDCVSRLCGSHTNSVSASYLRAILQGAPFERMERVFGGLCGRETLNTALLTQVGSNSGAEMLLGMLLAFRVCGCNETVNDKRRSV